MASRPRKSQPRSRAHEGAPAGAPVEPKPARAPTAAEQRGQLLELFRGFHATHLLAFGQETGAFQQLANAGPHGLNRDELAERQGWFPSYARYFLEAAHALGILELASEAGVTLRSRFRLAAHMADILTDETSPDYRGEWPRLHALTALDYKRFPDLYRSGKVYPFAMHGEDFLRSAAAATRALPAWFLRDVLPRMPELRQRLEDGAHVLDVGCGAGWAIVKLAEEFPKCRIVGVDAEPNAIEMAKTLLVMRQLNRRAEARLVRGEAMDYEAEFDLVTFFLVLHTIPPNHRGAALDHAARALKRGGRVLVVDEAMPESPQEHDDPDRQATVVSQWYEGPWGHRYDTLGEMRLNLERAGLRVEQQIAAGRYVVFVAAKA